MRFTLFAAGLIAAVSAGTITETAWADVTITACSPSYTDCEWSSQTVDWSAWATTTSTTTTKSAQATDSSWSGWTGASSTAKTPAVSSTTVATTSSGWSGWTTSTSGTAKNPADASKTESSLVSKFTGAAVVNTASFMVVGAAAVVAAAVLG